MNERSVSIRPATNSDLPRMAEIFESARRYMASTGNPKQWGEVSPRPELVAADISRGESYVVTCEGRIVATFALVSAPDPHYSIITDGPGWEESEVPYMTLHRVASDGTVSGLMQRIIAWSATWSDHLRIDTHADNAIMLRHIERAGFRFCGIVLMDDGSPRRAFQRIVRSKVTAAEIEQTLMESADEEQRRVLMRFFKTGKGQYGEGDSFLGLRVPQTRAVVREAALQVSFPEIARLLQSPWHEVRLAGFLLLAGEMKSAMPRRGKDSFERAVRRQLIAEIYLRNAGRANNWDLVDLSAPYIFGEWLLTRLPDGSMPDTSILDELAADADMWRQRIAMVSTWALIRAGRFDDTLRIARTLLKHPHDLLHKAVGWMLREVGKRDIRVLLDFLDIHHAEMSRTTLRYAIERLPEWQRQYYLKL